MKAMDLADPDLFVGSGVSESDPLDLRSGVSCRTGTAAETRGRVDAADPHVARHHLTLETAQINNSGKKIK